MHIKHRRLLSLMPTLAALAVMVGASVVPATLVLCIAPDSHARMESLFDECCASRNMADHEHRVEAHGELDGETDIDHEACAGSGCAACFDCVDLLLDRDAVKHKRTHRDPALYGMQLAFGTVPGADLAEKWTDRNVSPPRRSPDLSVLDTVVLLT